MKNILSNMQVIELAENIQVSSFTIDEFDKAMQGICRADLNIVHKIHDINDFKIDASKVQVFFQWNRRGIMILTVVDKFEAFTGFVFYNSGTANTTIEVFYVDPNRKPIPEQINQQLSTLVRYPNYLPQVCDDIKQQGVCVSDVSAKFLFEYYYAIIANIKKTPVQLVVCEPLEKCEEPLEGYKEPHESIIADIKSQAQSVDCEPLEECEEPLEGYEEYDSFEAYIGSSESSNEYSNNVTFLNTIKFQPKNTTNLYTFGKDFFKKSDGNSTIGTLISLSSAADASWYQQYLLWRDAHKYVF